MIDIIRDALGDLDEDILFAEVEKAVNAGTPAGEILDSLQAGLDIVGDRFGAGEYFLSELMMSADLFNEASEMLGDDAGGEEKETIGTFVMATVETDIHDIGKNIVVNVMKSNGFKVYDLGVDVPVQTVVDKVREYQPQIIGLSCLLTTCFDKMKETIDAIKAAGLNEGRLILIGGGPVDDNTVKYVGADRRCPTAQDTVNYSKEFLGVK